MQKKSPKKKTPTARSTPTLHEEGEVLKLARELFEIGVQKAIDEYKQHQLYKLSNKKLPPIGTWSTMPDYMRAGHIAIAREVYARLHPERPNWRLFPAVMSRLGALQVLVPLVHGLERELGTAIRSVIPWDDEIEIREAAAGVRDLAPSVSKDLFAHAGELYQAAYPKIRKAQERAAAKKRKRQ